MIKSNINPLIRYKAQPNNLYDKVQPSNLYSIRICIHTYLCNAYLKKDITQIAQLQWPHIKGLHLILDEYMHIDVDFIPFRIK